MKIKTFERLSEITKNDGKILLYDDGIVGRSTEDLSDILSDATTGKADKDKVYTKTEVNELIADFGGFTIAAGTGEDMHPDVSTTDTKLIYLVKTGTARKKDKYSEWIWVKDNETGEFGWECIGETSFELNLSAGTDLKYEDGVMSVDTNGYIGNSTHGFVEGNNTSALGNYSHAEGNSTIADGDYSHAEGFSTYTDGTNSHAEGYHTSANTTASHSEGGYTFANGDYSHAEGYASTALGFAAHVEGGGYDNFSPYTWHGNLALGKASHAEGFGTQAIQEYSHAEGYKTTANGNNTHLFKLFDKNYK